MSRRQVCCGCAVLLSALAVSAPALAGGGSATDQGYPSPLAPASVSGSSQPAAPTAPASQTGVSGAQVSRTPAPKAAVGGVAGAQKTLSKGHPAGAVSPAGSTGVLPFTGLQLAVFALVALGLIGGGLALRASKRGG